jgi:hypothetical protein
VRKDEAARLERDAVGSSSKEERFSLLGAAGEPLAICALALLNEAAFYTLN